MDLLKPAGMAFLDLMLHVYVFCHLYYDAIGIYIKYIYIAYIYRFSFLLPRIYRLALLAVLKLEPNSLGVLAPVCSSMGFLASSTTLRTSMLPLGDTSRCHVEVGNVLAFRFIGCTTKFLCGPLCGPVSCWFSLSMLLGPPPNLTVSIVPASFRAILLAWVLVALGHTFILEQPHDSHFRSFPQWRYFCKYICVVP